YASMPPSVPQPGCVELPQARVRVPAVDHQLLAVLLRRIEHHVGEQLLHDAAQRARAELLLHRVLDDGPKRAFLELQLHAVDLQRLALLPRQRIGRLGQDAVQLLRGQLLELDVDRKAPEQLREHAVLDQLLHPQARGAHAPPGAAEADLAIDLHLVQIGERARADEEDVAGVDLDEIVLVPVLRDVEGNEDLAPFEELEQRLLHALAADVAAAGAGARASGPARDLVDLVDEDDPAL